MNFKKNEKNYDPGNSEVFKMLQELEKAPREPEPGIDIDPADASPAQKGLASRTIQSRAFRRIQESVPLDSPKSPTGKIIGGEKKSAKIFKTNSTVHIINQSLNLCVFLRCWSFAKS